MKKYIKPSLTIFSVNTENCIMQTSIEITGTQVNSGNLAAGEYEELIDDEEYYY